MPQIEPRGCSILFQRVSDATAVPANVAAQLASIRATEEAESKRTAAALDAAWKEVESIVELNKLRDQQLARLNEAVAEYHQHGFWTEAELGNHFHLTPAIPPEGGSTVAADDDLMDDASSIATTTRTISSSRAADMAKYAPAAERLAPIRRCFANILAKRSSVPKECTLLMRGIEELQKRVVPIEESLAKSRFKLPMHAPFQAIAKLISRTLIPAKTGQHLEDEVSSNMSKEIKALEAEYLALETTKDPKVVYAFLEKEASARRRFHDAMLQLIEEASQVEKTMRRTFGDAHTAATMACNDSLDSISGQALHVTETSKTLVDEVVALQANGTSAADEELAALRNQLKEAQHRLSRGKKNQESYTRQVRELIKTIKSTQAANETTTAEVAKLTSDIARLEAAKAQFVGSCTERRAMLVDAHQACEYVNEVIAQVAKEAQTALELCRQHESRAVSEETYRKLRIARQPMQNAQEWYRCLGDLMRIRVHRRDDIRQRMAGSWQLEFLLSQEEQSQCVVISQYEAELQHIQAQWAKLTTTLVDLEMHVPVIHQYDRNPTVMRMRNAFLAIEGIGKDKDMKDAHKQLLLLEQSISNDASDTVLPPVPPPRNRKSLKDPATGTRQLPRPPSGGVKRGTSTPPTVPLSARPPSRQHAVTLPAIGSASPPPASHSAR